MEYFPQNFDNDPAKMPGFLREELNRLRQALAAPQKMFKLVELHAQPAKLGAGDVVFADGTDWKPNGTGGKGIWYYNGSAWVQLG